METIRCYTCREEKPLSDFHVQRKAKDGVQSSCKACVQSTYNAHARELFEYKGGKCAHCNLRDLDRPWIYDYHHTDPATKLYNVTAIMGSVKEKLHAEADKCILLCANCHRSEHERLRKELRANEQQEQRAKQPEQQEQQGQTIQYMLC